MERFTTAQLTAMDFANFCLHGLDQALIREYGIEVLVRWGVGAEKVAKRTAEGWKILNGEPPGVERLLAAINAKEHGSWAGNAAAMLAA